MSQIRRMVLDILKPYEPSMIDFAQEVESAPGVKGVNAILIEIDEEVQNIKITLEGNDIDYSTVEDKIGNLGGSVHSVDEIVCGEKIVEESETPQD